MINRPTREECLLDTARIWARRSTCTRLAVGAVIAIESRIIVQGYNGPPSGMPHCDHTTDSNPCEDSCHAEKNAIDFCAKHGLATANTSLYVTHAPCRTCAKSIINAGIVQVVYDKDFRDMSGVELLISSGVEVTIRASSSHGA